MHEEWTLLKRLIWLWRVVKGGASSVLRTATGAIIHITDALAKPAHELVAVLKPVQSGTGDPSPDNVRPISGWTGANITRTGKNIFDKTNVLTSCAIANDKIIGHATYDLYFVPLKENTTYTFNRTAGTSSYPQFGLSEEYPQIGTTVSNYTSLRYQNPYTFNSGNYKYALFALYKSSGNECSVVIGSDSIPNTEPYYGQTIPINWQDTAGTVYGCTVTLNEDGSADVFADWYSRTFDGDTYYINGGVGKASGFTDIYECFNYFGSGGLIDIPKGLTNNPAYNLSDKAICRGARAYVTNSDLLQFQVVANDYMRMYFNASLLNGITESSTSTEILNAMRSYLRSNPVTIVLKCVSGVTYHFDNIGQLQLFLGENNIWVDASDDLTLTYYSSGKDSDNVVGVGRVDYMKLLT